MEKNYKIENDEAVIKINKNIYSKEILIQACYVKLEDLFFLIDEEKEDYIISLKFKDENENKHEKLKEVVYEFFDELIESASYIDQLKRTSELRQTILERALLTQKRK